MVHAKAKIVLLAHQNQLEWLSGNQMSVKSVPDPLSSRSRPPRAEGFTLIELLVTLAVLAILASVGIPAFQGMIERSRVTTAANEALAGLNLAKSEAIRLNVPIRFCVNTSSGAWMVEHADGGDLRTGNIPASVGITASNLDIASIGGHACVHFRPDGLPYVNGQLANGSLALALGDAGKVVSIRAGAIHVGQ